MLNSVDAIFTLVALTVFAFGFASGFLVAFGIIGWRRTKEPEKAYEVDWSSVRIGRID